MTGELFCFVLTCLKLLMTIYDKKIPFLSILKAVALRCLHQGRKTHALLSKLQCPVSVKMMHSTDISSRWYQCSFQ